MAMCETRKRSANAGRTFKRTHRQLSYRIEFTRAPSRCAIDFDDRVAKLGLDLLLWRISAASFRKHSRQVTINQLARHQQAGSVEIRLPLLPILGVTRPATKEAPPAPEQSNLRRVLGEQMAMQTPMPAALMGKRETIAAFLRRVLLWIEALVDHDPGRRRRKLRRGCRVDSRNAACRTVCGCRRTRCRA